MAVEAQAMHSTIIATNIGAARETVLDNQTGFLITPDDPHSLSNALRHALNLSEAEKIELHQYARKRVTTTFNKQQMLQQTLAVYQECL